MSHIKVSNSVFDYWYTQQKQPWSKQSNSCWLCADYVIPKGCFVVPFLSAVHLDESYYKESLSFNPWRWLDPETQVFYFALLPKVQNKPL